MGHRLVDRYLGFVAGRARPNTVRAVAFDLKTFFGIVGKDPVEPCQVAGEVDQLGDPIQAGLIPHGGVANQR